MVNKKTVPILIILTTFLIFSCENKQKNNDLLLQIEGLMQQHPDSALLLIETIESPEKLSEEQYANYLLLSTQAKHKNDISIANDTLLDVSIRYYTKKKDHSKLAWSYYYHGQMLFEKDGPEYAMNDLQQAQQYAENIPDFNLLGLIYHCIGYFLKNQFNPEEALQYYQLSQSAFKKAGNIRFEQYTYGHIGNAYLCMENNMEDSAIINFHRALKYAESINDSSSNAYWSKNIGVAYSNIKDNTKAKVMLQKALVINPAKNTDITSVALRRLAEIYIENQQLDSAYQYINQVSEMRKPDDGPTAKYVYYLLLYELYKSTGDYQLALENLELCRNYSDTVYLKIIDQSIFDIRQKYDKSQLEIVYNKSNAQRRYLSFTITIIILLGILTGCFFTYRIKAKEAMLLETERALQTFQGMIEEQDEKIQDLNHALTGQDKRREQLQGYLINRLDIARKIAQMNVVSTDNTKEFMEQFQKIFGENLLDWENIYPVINNLYDGFADKIKAMSPKLLTKDIQLCCFIRAGFKTEEIAVLLNYTQSTVRVKKTRLSRKMGFDEYNLFLEHINSL